MKTPEEAPLDSVFSRTRVEGRAKDSNCSKGASPFPRSYFTARFSMTEASLETTMSRDPSPSRSARATASPSNLSPPVAPESTKPGSFLKYPG